MTSPTLFDPGLQPERTALAWRRTALSICVGSLIALRVLPLLSSPWEVSHLWLIPGLFGLAYGVWLWWRAHVRYERLRTALRNERMDEAPGAGMIAVLTAFMMMCGCVALIVVVLNER